VLRTVARDPVVEADPVVERLLLGGVDAAMQPPPLVAGAEEQSGELMVSAPSRAAGPVYAGGPFGTAVVAKAVGQGEG
jgi:hypothetical protein